MAVEVKSLPANAEDARDAGLIPGLERSPGVGNGNPLQYSCLEISWTEEPSGLQTMGSQSQTWLRDFHYISKNSGKSSINKISHHVERGITKCSLKENHECHSLFALNPSSYGSFFEHNVIKSARSFIITWKVFLVTQKYPGFLLLERDLSSLSCFTGWVKCWEYIFPINLWPFKLIWTWTHVAYLPGAWGVCAWFPGASAPPPPTSTSWPLALTHFWTIMGRSPA